MTGIFSLQPPHLFSFPMIPLILYTLWWAWTMLRDFGGLSEYVALSSVCEVQRGEGVEEVVGVREGATRSQRWVHAQRPEHTISTDSFGLTDGFK